MVRKITHNAAKVLRSARFANSQTQNRISIENTIKKINNKLNVVLNREMDIFELSMNKIKSHIDAINVENWKIKLADSKKADTYKLFKNMPNLKSILII